ncbi:MAG: hypothetical protein JOZ15_10585 [Acidobacteria bacterium]|nr:hypothetical protein [Acidobacteriota bacterium]
MKQALSALDLFLLVVRAELIREEMQERWEAAYEAHQEKWANVDLNWINE